MEEFGLFRDLFPGSYSDKLIAKKSYICQSLKAGDIIIAVKGFPITDILPKGVMLNMALFFMNPQIHQTISEMYNRNCTCPNSRRKGYTACQNFSRNFS